VKPTGATRIPLACEQVSGKLNVMLRELAHYCAVRDCVDTILISYGPRQRWPAVADDDAWMRLD